MLASSGTSKTGNASWRGRLRDGGAYCGSMLRVTCTSITIYVGDTFDSGSTTMTLFVSDMMAEVNGFHVPDMDEMTMRNLRETEHVGAAAVTAAAMARSAGGADARAGLWRRVAS